MRSTRWHTSPLPYSTVRKLSESLNSSDVLASVLARRGYTDPEAAGRFLSPWGELYDPFLFPQMADVCSRVRAAISRGDKICIHGDYDVDGITATALMVGVLEELGAAVSHHLPNRFSQGYGINAEAVERIASDGASLLITVDCGIGAREPLARARELGLDVIVIDHHRPVKENLPEAAIISPRLCDYPFKDLAGVGLAFKVAQALFAGTGEDRVAEELNPALKRQLDLVALGTIADVVPLIDENRSLVKRGLARLARTPRPGLKALMRAGQVEPSRINAGMVAFRLAPRINAAGRLEDPGPSLELLLTEDSQQAEKLAGHLDSLNRERQKIENQMLSEAREIVGKMPDKQRNSRGYVLSSPGWHEGVIGIVASRMVEMHYRPVIMIAEGQTHGKGSGRSIPAFDLHGSLVDLSGFFKSYGGHRSACGLTIELDKIPEFQRQFAAYADSRLSGDDLRPSRYVDALVCSRELTLELAEELARLEPFGLGNPSVDLLTTGARIQNGSTTKNGQHLRCLVEAGGVKSSAIGFGQAFMMEKLDSAARWDVVFRLEQNEFNGSVSPQLNLRELIPHPKEQELPPGFCNTRCDFSCPDRIGGDEFWTAIKEGAPIPETWQKQAGTAASGKEPWSSSLAGRVIDRRNFGGISGQIAKLISTGENVLLLAADVARRRNQLIRELSLPGSEVQQVLLASSRCSRTVLERRTREASENSPTVMLADFVTASTIPGLAGGFDHIVFIDPPLNQSVFDALAAAAPDSYIHLFHCADEVQFTGKVLDHEFNLRAPLAKVYKHLKLGDKHPFDETTEKLLLAGGKYLRQPAIPARCLKVLEELALVSVEKKAGKPILTLRKTGKTSLEKSPTYNQIHGFYRECLKYLSKSLDLKMT